MIYFIILLLAYLYFQMAIFTTNKLFITSKKIKGTVRIAQISDFHCNKFINLNSLKRSLKKFNPHIIVLTGDMVNRHSVDFKVVESLLKSISLCSTPVYFISGNHEEENKSLKEFIEVLKSFNVITFIDEKSFYLSEYNLQIFGLNYKEKKLEQNIILQRYNLLLAHSFNRLITQNKSLGMDLILAGHTHGGQVRCPFLGQVIGHGFKFFPKYSKGVYNFEEGKVFIDSGLGNTFLPLRFFNRVSYSQIEIRESK